MLKVLTRFWFNKIFCIHTHTPCRCCGRLPKFDVYGAKVGVIEVIIKCPNGCEEICNPIYADQFARFNFDKKKWGLFSDECWKLWEENNTYEKEKLFFGVYRAA